MVQLKIKRNDMKKLLLALIPINHQLIVVHRRKMLFITIFGISSYKIGMNKSETIWSDWNTKLNGM